MFELRTSDPKIAATILRGVSIAFKDYEEIDLTEEQYEEHQKIAAKFDAKATKPYRQRLTQKEIRAIKKAVKSKTQKDVAKEFGVNPCTVSRVVNGYSYSNV
jgi:predicted DNA binding protein